MENHENTKLAASQINMEKSMITHRTSIYKFKKVTGWYGVRLLFVCLLPLLHTGRFGQMLRCAHKRIVNTRALRRRERTMNSLCH